MKHLALAAALATSGALLLAQDERPVPSDSSRITVEGCTRGRTLIVMEREGHEIRSREVAPGRRFRLSGPKHVLSEIEKREGSMVQVTGLVRKADLTGTGGITGAGGRVRIGGGAPQAQVGSGPSRSIATPDAVLDVEGWNRLPEPCPSR
jgi:hypothetical protein